MDVVSKEILLSGMKDREDLVMHYANIMIRHMIIMTKIFGNIKNQKTSHLKCVSLLEDLSYSREDPGNTK